MSDNVAIAISAHPDDIEFYMAGTMLLLCEAGYDLHYLTLANGCCGGTQFDAPTIARTRAEEAKRAADLLGATFHPSFCNDLEIVYALNLLRQLAAIIREVKPTLILTHPPVDYMEDHTCTCRLVVTAAFAREMPNFVTTPERKPYSGDITIYHSTPHGLTDPLGHLMVPDLFVNVEAVHNRKCDALAAHKSQSAWLETSQGATSLISMLNAFSTKVGELSPGFRHAEGWWKHSHLGFCREEADPLREALGSLANTSKDHSS
ncbi:MAG: PIG-L family deacetylase [Verrucomicrobia bacterium]|nr:PIG-L family deacetylase [Verrucomicrobiota bacterium]